MTHLPEKKVGEDLVEAKANSYSSLRIGISQNHGRQTILEKLNKQGEDIVQIQDTLESNDYLLGKSATLLRNMTWGGYMYNSCVNITNSIKSAPSLLLPEVNKNSISEVADTSKLSATSNCANSSSVGENDDLRLGATTSDLSTAASRFIDKKFEEEEKELEEISSIVAQLQEIGVSMGDQLDKQNQQLEQIEVLTDKVAENTLFVTLRATQLSTRVKGRGEQIFVGKYQFIDCEEGKFLGVLTSSCTAKEMSANPLDSLDDSLVLKSVPDRSTYFNVFASSDGVRNIFGIQNEKTLKFIGCTMWGTVRCASAYFGTQEECFIDLDGAETGLLLLARNWGSGGWLRFATNDANGGKRFVSTTKSIHDKDGMVMFKAIPEEFGVRMR